MRALIRINNDFYETGFTNENSLNRNDLLTDLSGLKTGENTVSVYCDNSKNNNITKHPKDFFKKRYVFGIDSIDEAYNILQKYKFNTFEV